MVRSNLLLIYVVGPILPLEPPQRIGVYVLNILIFNKLFLLNTNIHRLSILEQLNVCYNIVYILKITIECILAPISLLDRKKIKNTKI